MTGTGPTTPTSPPTRPGTTPAPGGGSGTAIAVDVEAPGAVRNLTVVTNENSTPQEELLISWEAPNTDTGGPVTSYRIDISEDGERWLAYLTDHGDSDLRLVHPSDDNPGLDADGLVAETTRYFRVFAFYDKSADERIFGPGSDASGTTAASWAPDAPKNLGGDRRIIWVYPNDHQADVECP